MAKYSINDDRFSVVNLNLFSSHSYLLTWYEDWRASGRIVIQSRFEWRSFRPQVVSPPNQSRFASDQSRFASKLILNQKVDALRSKRFGWLGMLLKRANTSADHLICRTSKRHEQTLRMTWWTSKRFGLWLGMLLKQMIYWYMIYRFAPCTVY